MPLADPMLQPFLRRGEPVELTAGDFATRGKMHFKTATGRLSRFLKDGLVGRRLVATGGFSMFVYFLTEKGANAPEVEPQPAPAPPTERRKPVTRAELVDQVARLALRSNDPKWSAVISIGDVQDRIRELLIEEEDRLRAGMAADAAAARMRIHRAALRST